MNRIVSIVLVSTLLAVFIQATALAQPLFRSSLRSSRGWAPEQATGEPNTPEAGDQTTAWASATPDGADEWLELEYAAPVLAAAVLIHETYNPGAVVKVTGYTETGMDAELWAGKDPTPQGSGKGVSEIAIKGMLETKRIRLHINSKNVPGWNEIDAVGLRDSKGKIHWAVAAKASSTYGAGFAMAAPFDAPFPLVDVVVFAPGPVGAPVGGGKRAWSAEQVLGEPDTKEAGDQVTAWASATPDGADEWLEVEFAEAAKIETVQIYETYNPGAVYKVTGYNEKGKEEDLWEGKDPTDPKAEMGTSEIPVKGKLKTKKIRIYIKSKDVPGYNEIDAVSIKDAAGKVQWAAKATASSNFGDRFGGGFLPGGGDVEVLGGPRDAPAVPAIPFVPRGARVAVDPREARIEKLEKEVAELKKSLEEIRKLLPKGK